MKNKKIIDLLIPLLFAITLSLSAYFGWLTDLDYYLYDFLLSAKRPVVEDPSILLVDADDYSINRIGVWPWSRDIPADALFLLKELGADFAVFDIEYTEKSPVGVNPVQLNSQIPLEVDNQFQVINSNTSDLLDAMRENLITVEDSYYFEEDLKNFNLESRDRIKELLQSIARDNDEYLSQGASFFGRSYFTVNMLTDGTSTLDETARQAFHEAYSVKIHNGSNDSLSSVSAIYPSLDMIIEKGSGIGFTNVVIDEDGVRRRIDLLTEWDGQIYPQLVFGPVLDLLGNPELELTENGIVLKDARIENDAIDDINIPLTENGKFMINWPKGDYLESFRHLSFYDLFRHRELELLLYDKLNQLREDRPSFFSYYYDGDESFPSLFALAEELKLEIADEDSEKDYAIYRETRDRFFTQAADFANGETEDRILTDLEKYLQTEGLTENQLMEAEDFREYVTISFANIKEYADEIGTLRQALSDSVKGSFCIIGSSATSTYDRGVNPFFEEYANLGTHAAIANSIMRNDFITVLPRWISIAATFLFSFLIFCSYRIKGSALSVATQTGVVFLLIGLLALPFIAGGYYIAGAVPLLSCAGTILAMALLYFYRVYHEKNFIRGAFGQYLSKDVIEEIMADPEKLNLGGEKKRLTAIFTDVKGFTSISEKLDPVDLVQRLNTYLTEMSDTILERNGTIDKYEGDAIIAFFGAPINLADHPFQACDAAIQMKRAEEKLNRELLSTGELTTPFLTRIGINTGEMVVGNMGTRKKMDYTIIGNEVNLTSRLEGVNKLYNTWILISERTYAEVSDQFICRKLDRVRVVGMNEPVRIYELIEYADQIDEEKRKGIEQFHRAIDLFENRHWQKAEEAFQGVLSLIPEDGPAEVFIERCKKYMLKPPSQQWDGVFNLTNK